MRRLIFLTVDLGKIPDNITSPSSVKWKEWEKKLAEQAVQEFEAEAKKLKQIEVIRNYLPQAEVLIEFADDLRDEMYITLRAIEVVEYIDSFVRKE